MSADRTLDMPQISGKMHLTKKENVYLVPCLFGAYIFCRHEKDI